MEKSAKYIDNFYAPDNLVKPSGVPSGTWYTEEEYIKAFHYAGKIGWGLRVGLFYPKMNDTQRLQMLNSALAGKEKAVDDDIRGAGYIMDRNAGLSQAEANAKWGKEFYTEPKGVIGKVVGGALGGLLVGGPIGAVVGAVSAGIANDQQVKAAQQKAKAETDAVKQTVESVKKHIATNPTTSQSTTTKTSSGILPDIEPINIGGVEINPLYIGAGLFLLLGVFLIFKK